MVEIAVENQLEILIAVPVCVRINFVDIDEVALKTEAAEVGDRIVGQALRGLALLVELEGVAAETPGEVIDSETTGEGIVSLCTVQLIVTGEPGDKVDILPSAV